MFSVQNVPQNLMLEGMMFATKRHNIFHFFAAKIGVRNVMNIELVWRQANSTAPAVVLKCFLANLLPMVRAQILSVGHPSPMKDHHPVTRCSDFHRNILPLQFLYGDFKPAHPQKHSVQPTSKGLSPTKMRWSRWIGLKVSECILVFYRAQSASPSSATAPTLASGKS